MMKFKTQNSKGKGVVRLRFGFTSLSQYIPYLRWAQVFTERTLVSRSITLFLTFNFLLLTFVSPAHAAVDISKEYGFGDIGTLGEGIDRLVTPAFSIAATAVVIYFIYAAFKYTTSGGDKDAVGEAQKMITHSIIGFVLLMFLFLVMNFLFFRLFGANIQLFKGF